jgi:hypothetical protein
MLGSRAHRQQCGSAPSKCNVIGFTWPGPRVELTCLNCSVCVWSISILMICQLVHKDSQVDSSCHSFQYCFGCCICAEYGCVQP